MSLFNELKRRNVFRVGIAYIVMAWLVMQVADVILNNVEAPGWIFHVIMLCLGIGFLFAMFFAWAFELTPEGLKREHEVDRSQSIAQQTGKKIDRLITGVLVLALAYFILDKFVLSAGREEAAIEAALEQAGAATVAQTDDAKATTEPDKSIAVLPFVNMSSDAEQEYFSDGLSEELLNLLAKIPELRVAARTSSFSLKGKEMQISEIGEILKVAHVLEGSVRKSGDRVRITAQLIKADDGYHLWSETFDREMDDVFVIQDEIARKVVEALKVTLLGNTPSPDEANPEAYALVLQARHFERQRSEESLRRAEQLFKQALEIEPEYPAAWAGLSNVYFEQAGSGLRPSEEGYRLAIEAANYALSVDPNYPAAHAALGSVFLLRNDIAGSARHLKIALDLDPANPDVLTNAATLVELLGRPEEAIKILQFVVARDPVNADGHAGLGRSYRVSHRWDEAIESYRTSLALSPGRFGSYQGIGESFLFKGDLKAAAEAYAAEPDEEWAHKGKTLILFSQDRSQEFESAFTELRERWGAQWPSEIAHVYAWSGNRDAAFEHLSRAVDQNEEGLNQQYYQPLLQSLHDDPRWAEFRTRTLGSEAQLARIQFEVHLPE